MQNPQLELLTVPELAEELGIGRTAAYALLREGKIKSLKNGRDWKIPRLAVEEYILENSGLSIRSYYSSERK